MSGPVAAAPSGTTGPRSLSRQLALAVPSLRGPLLGSVALGLCATAAVVVQALALADLLGGAMPGARAHNRAVALGVLGGAIALRAAIAPVQALLGHRGASRAKAALRERLLSSTLEARGAADGGALATLTGRGLDALDPYVGRCLPDLLLGVLAPVALAAAIGGLDWVSGIVVAVAVLLFPLFGALVGRATLSLAADRWSEVRSLGTRVADLFEGMAILRGFGRSGAYRQRLADANDALARASLSTLRLAFLSALVLDTLASVSVALVAVPLGLRLLDGSIHLVTALAVLIVAPEVFVPLRRASAEFHESAEGLSALGSLFATIGPVGPLGPAPRAPAPDPATAPVSLGDVDLVFPGRTGRVLRAASLTIAPGETVALIGANGAGKSSVLALLLGFLAPSRGVVSVGGQDLATVDLEDWRRRLAYLPEHPSILRATLADNLRLAAPEAPRPALARVLAELGAAHLVPLLEDPAPLLDPGDRPLSAGERQRIGLARLLLRPASLYLLDEPTVHLDEASEAAVVAALARELPGRSALIVTHRPALLALADRVVTLRDGRFVPAPSPGTAPMLSAPPPVSTGGRS